MSTILKALRRLEREKQPQPGKPLRDDVVALQPGEPQEGPDRTLWWASRVGMPLILVLGGLWLAPGIREDGQKTEGTRAPTAARADAPVLASEAVVPVPPPARRVQEQAAPAAARPPARRTRAPQPTVSGKPTSPPKPAPAAVERPRPVAAPAPERADPVAERPHRLPDPKPLHAFEAQTARVAAPVAVPEPEAFTHPATRFHSDSRRARDLVWANLPPFYWFFPTLKEKPGAKP